jgi:hypothetical protein
MAFEVLEKLAAADLSFIPVSSKTSAVRRGGVARFAVTGGLSMWVLSCVPRARV